MTNAEAIDLLDNLIGMVEDSQDNDYDEALKMGIKALERTPNAHPTHECVKPTHECVEPVGNSDTLDEDMISRCELFNKLAVIPAPPEANEYKAEVYKVINGM